MGETKEKGHNGDILKYFIGGGIAVIALMILFAWLMHWVFNGKTESQGQFGDQFGAMNTLFTGLAFFGLVLTIFFQSRDLRAQTRALELQQVALQQQIEEFKAQRDELERSAKAQEESNRLARLNLEVELFRQKLSYQYVKLQDNPRLNVPNDRVVNLLRMLELHLKQAKLNVGDHSPEKT